MRSACREYRRALIEQQPLGGQGDHVRECEACRRFRDRELATQNALRELRTRWPAPAELRSRVGAALAEERGAAAQLDRRRFHRRVAVAVVGIAAAGVAAALAIGQLGSAGSTAQARGAREAHETARALVEDHLEYARGRAAHDELGSPAPERARAYFETELALAVRVPSLSHATFTGARRCSVRGRPAALLFYEHHGTGASPEPVSLFVFEPAGEDFSGMDEVEGLAGKRTCHHHDRGVGLLVWQERGLTYALTAALERDELRELLAEPSN